VNDLPRQDEAERSVLGGILVDPPLLFEVSGRLRPDHFAHPYHRVIFGAMLKMATENRPVDPLMLQAELGTLRDEIGPAFLAGLMTGTPRKTNVGHYAKMVIDAAKLRGAILKAQAVIEAASAPIADAESVIEDAQAAYFALADDAPRKTLWSAEEMTAELFQALEAGGVVDTKALRVGLPSVDAIFDGFSSSDWILLGGRPSTGKTALAIQIALKTAEQVPVLVCSAEMRHAAVWRRALSHVTRLGAWQLSRLRDKDYGSVSHGLSRLGNLRLWLDDTPSMSDMHVLSVARRVQMQHGLGLVIVDYLQLLHAAESARDRQQELGAVTRSLKQIARVLDVPVLTLAALSRAAANERPTMAHIRECGTAEYDADVVLLMHRDLQAQKDATSGAPSPVELIVEKQRNGATGAVQLLYFGDTYRFESVAIQGA
jgi:replicative DNA helicase